MKALSLRQPWAWLVVHGGKGLENRRWNTSFRGEFLIHAAKGMTREEYEDALLFAEEAVSHDLGEDDAADACNDLRVRIPSFAEMVRGGIVGRARLVSVISPCAGKGTVATLFGCQHPWHMPEQYGFVLEDVKPMPFVRWSGALGFFNVPESALMMRAHG